ncbi:MAG TPA: glycoside hydrolase family 57 protein [Chryseosolibacter sp.]|nr:glycoside hydrolase family 57 protein [Chryseosolibacter sp.]
MVFYFQVHQPRRLRTLRFFDIGSNKNYFDDRLNKEIIQRVAANCYLPTNALLLKLIRKHPDIKVAFSISGITIDQLEEYAPEVLDSFRRLAETGSVEFLTETYYHSLACLLPGNEFEFQIAKHQSKILKHFGFHARVFRNTELIHSEETAARIRRLGFTGVMIDGVERVLEHRSPHHVFEHEKISGLKALLRNYRLSDDISFRFSQSHPPLTVDQYLAWLKAIPMQEGIINLGMDYETFGEHQKKETGIFSFLERLLTRLARSKDFSFTTPSRVVENTRASEKLTIPGFISWADEERDLSAWLGNEMQRDAFDSLIKLERDIKNLHNKTLLTEWRTLQTSDHFYYMSTKKGNDGGVHSYFSPYPSPYEAFINYMNVLTDFALRVKIHKSADIVEGSIPTELVRKEVRGVPA